MSPLKLELPSTKINARYVFHTRRYALFAVGLAVFSVGVLLLVIVPQIMSIWNRYGELRQQEEVLAKLEAKSLQLQEMPQSELFRNADRINQTLPTQKPLLELLSALNVVAAESGVRYSDLSLSPGKIASEGASLQNQPGGGTGSSSRTTGASRPSSAARRTGVTGVESLSVQLIANGSLANINTFLRQIERVAPLTTVTQLSLIERLASRSDQTSDFEAELVIETYFFTQAVSATLAAPLPDLNVSQQLTINEINTFLFPTVMSQEAIINGGLEDLFGVADYALEGSSL